VIWQPWLQQSGNTDLLYCSRTGIDAVLLNCS